MKKLEAKPERSFSPFTPMFCSASFEKSVTEVSVLRSRVFSFGVAMTTTSSTSTTREVSVGVGTGAAEAGR